MNLLVTILLVVAGLVALLLLLALFLKRSYHVAREVVIAAPRRQVFDFLKLLENQERFNKWAKTDANRRKEFRGTDGTVGFVYAWSGDKSAGEGEKEITAIVEGERIETELRFVKPMRVTAYAHMALESLAEEQTKVVLSNGG
ncbi:MAG: polyketide cyclase, partial [Chitinophagaceae bacterium]